MDEFHPNRMAEVSALARSATTAEERERLLDAMVALCAAANGKTSPEAATLLETIFLDLVGRAERDVRRRLADTLCTASWAPSALINTLALDDIEIARPIIALSPVLSEEDLIRVLTLATVAHHIEVARRPDIGPKVVAAILDGAEPKVLAALAGNPTADLSGDAMERLVGLSRRIVELQALLVDHPRLNRTLALALYAWVGETLRAEICARFHVDPHALEVAISLAVAESLGEAPLPAAAGQTGVPNQAEMERRLVAKLQAAGQLRPGFLLRALREDRLHLFEVALAAMTQVKTEAVSALVSAGRADLLALACAGVGIDRSVFPTILSLLKTLQPAAPFPGPRDQALATALTRTPGPEALAAFRRSVAEPNAPRTV